MVGWVAVLGTFITLITLSVLIIVDSPPCLDFWEKSSVYQLYPRFAINLIIGLHLDLDILDLSKIAVINGEKSKVLKNSTYVMTVSVIYPV